MRLFTLALASTILAGASAFAMPQFDGTYTCTNLADKTQTTATLTTRDNKLFVTGLGTGSVTGFPCDNSKVSETKGGMTLTTTSKCTDVQLISVYQQQQPSTNTDLSTELVVTKNSDSQVSVFLDFSGKTGGSSVGVKMNMDCRR